MVRVGVYRMFGIVLVTIMFGTLVTAASTPTTNWNEQIDFLLMWYDYATASNNQTIVKIPDIITNNVAIRKAKLANMDTLVRASDVYMEEPKVDDLKLYGTFSLRKFKLIVNDFRFKNYVGPANFTASKNTVKISYSLLHHSKPGQCKMDWDVFQLGPLTNVIMFSKNNEYNGRDITDSVNNLILPEINKLFNSASYKKKLNELLDFCFINIFK